MRLFPHWHTPDAVAARLVEGLKDGSLYVPWNTPGLADAELAERVSAQYLKVNEHLVKCGWEPIPMSDFLLGSGRLTPADRDKAMDSLSRMMASLDEIDLVLEDAAARRRLRHQVLIASWSLRVGLLLIAIGVYLSSGKPSLALGMIIGAVLGEFLPYLWERLSQRVADNDLPKRLVSLFTSIQKSEADLRRLIVR